MQTSVLTSMFVSIALLPGVAIGQGSAPGDGPAALPAAHRVGLVSTPGHRVSLSSRFGYGYTESVLGEGDSHHRLTGSLAVSVWPTRWLAIGLESRGRYDRHSSGDDGFVGDPWFRVRAGAEVASDVSVGVQAGVWLIGDDAPSIAFDATTVELELLLTWAHGDLHLGGLAGFRIDQSSRSVDDPNLFSRDDRLALGLNDANAVLIGVAATHRLGDVELFGELSWDVLVGEEAPSAGESPLRIAAGARYRVARMLELSGTLEVSPGSRPEVDVGQPLVNVDPRVLVLLGVAIRLPPPEAAHVEVEVEPEPEPEVEPEPEPEPEPEARPAGPRVVRGIVRQPGGAALPGATVRLGEMETSSDDDGRFEVALPAEGSAELTVEHPGFETHTATLTDAGEVALTLETAEPGGQIRGVVQSYDGSPIQATVRIRGVDGTLRADAEGRFEVDVPPGSYVVVIEAPGHQRQRRRVEVEDNGVTLLNVDLRRDR